MFDTKYSIVNNCSLCQGEKNGIREEYRYISMLNFIQPPLLKFRGQVS